MLGDEAAAAEVLAPLRELDPEIDMFGHGPRRRRSSRIHGDPERARCPAPAAPRCSARLPSEAVSAFVAAAGPGSGSPLSGGELRQLGGAVGRPAPEHGRAGAASTPRSPCSPSASAIGPGHRRRGQRARRPADRPPWRRGRASRRYLNFVEEPTDVRRPAIARTPTAACRRSAAQVDPDGLFHANHVIEGS